MSTILKALKRIDHTTPPPEDLQSLPLRINTKETLRARVYKIWLYRKLCFSLILLLAVIAAGWFVYSQKDLLLSKLPRAKQSSDKIPTDSNADKVTIYQAKINPNPGQSGHAAKKRTTPPGRQNIRIGTGAEKSHAGANLSSRPLPRMPAQQKIPILTSSDKTRSSEQTPTPVPEISRTQAAGSRKAIQRNPLHSAATPAEKTQTPPAQVSRSYQRLNDDKLKLQAIAWSNEAAQRIAVINGHVVREGESVEGFSVNQIRREDVIVNDGTQSWQLEFSLK